MTSGRDRFIDHVRIDQRFIALHIHDDIAVQRPGDLGDAVGARRVVRRGHDRFSPECGNRVHDAVVVSRHDDPVDQLRSFGALIDPLDHGFVLDQGERLSRETGSNRSGRE